MTLEELEDRMRVPVQLAFIDTKSTGLRQLIYLPLTDRFHVYKGGEYGSTSLRKEAVELYRSGCEWPVASAKGDESRIGARLMCPVELCSKIGSGHSVTLYYTPAFRLFHVVVRAKGREAPLHVKAEPRGRLATVAALYRDNVNAWTTDWNF